MLEWTAHLKDFISKGSLYLSFILLGRKTKENEDMQQTIFKQQKALQVAALPALSWNALLDWVRDK